MLRTQHRELSVTKVICNEGRIFGISARPPDNEMHELLYFDVSYCSLPSSTSYSVRRRWNIDTGQYHLHVDGSRYP